MRLILFYDLPNVESYETREYNQFRKTLLKNGYTMIQFSVYMKTINTQTKIDQEVKKITKYLPRNGNIRVISVTEKQYSNMYILVGKKKVNEIYNNTERYIKI